jgi:hypothetical protein
MAAAVAFRQSDMLVGYIGPLYRFAKRNRSLDVGCLGLLADFLDKTVLIEDKSQGAFLPAG